MDIGIIGGGMMGLATAHYVSLSGHNITLFEREKEIGGLSRSEELFPGFVWDRFYHVILSTDEELLRFIDEIGLSLDVQFKETKTGFFTGGKLHSMSTTSEFLSFKPLKLWDKFRLGAGILYASRINNWERLERLYVKNWLVKVFGRRNYEKMWEPLLRCKLGEAQQLVSAAFIWGIIKRLYGTRKKGSKKELLGCVKGGYHSILSQARQRLLEKGVRVVTREGVEIIESRINGGIRVRTQNKKEFEFDKVISTIPNPELIRIWPDIPKDFKEILEKVKYLRLVCAVLVLKKGLSPYYVTNLTDPGLPFTGIIEATNIIPKEIIGEKALVYLPKYMAPHESFYAKSDQEILGEFVPALQKIIPEFNSENLLSCHVFREPHVQPLQEVNYSMKIPPMKTPLRDLYMVNTTMILNSTLNNNQVVLLARKMADVIIGDKLGLAF